MATIISFSGGETSAYMTIKMLQRPKDDYTIIFANTGEEMEETLEFVRNVENYIGVKIWRVEADYTRGVRGCQFKIVDFGTASRKGEPFEKMISKYGIPDMGAPICSKYLKERVIRAFAKQHGLKKYKTAIGIRIDEPGRLNWKTAKKMNLVYPLAVDMPTTKPEINKFWQSMPFRLGIKSYEGNCKVCWKKSLRKLMTIAVDHPERFDFFRRMEIEYGDYIPEGKPSNNIVPPLRFYRDKMSVDDIFEEAALGFDKAVDEKNITAIQRSLWDEYLDSNLGCTESCEVF